MISTENKIRTGSGVALLALLLIGATAYYRLNEQAEANRQVLHTYAVLTELANLLSAAKDAETGQRGYLLTGRADFLEPYNTAIATLDERVERITQLTADNPQQQERLGRLRPLIAQKQSFMRDTIALRDAKGLEAAQTLVLSARGKTLMDAIRTLLAKMEIEEYTLLQQRSERAQADVRSTLIVMVAGGVLAFLFMLVALLVINYDFRLRQGAEQALRVANALQRAILDSANYMIISTDPQGVIRTFNRAAQLWLGYREDEVLGKETSLLFHDLDEVRARGQALGLRYSDAELPVFEAFAAAILKGKVGELEWTYIRKDGSRFIGLMSLTILRDDAGTITGFVGVTSDITERKKLDQLKSDFISTVSHELRTPLTAIRGSLGLLTGGVGGELPAQAKSLIEIAHTSSKRLVRLINDILDIDKIESGKMALELQPTELMPLLEQAIAANRGYAEQFHVRYQLGATLAGVKVRADHDRLMQVITNLLSNAAKFSSPGDVVSVSVARHNSLIRTAVTDHGPGVPEQFRSMIFHKFAQADASDTRSKGGSGLGLNITKALIEKMDGTVGFDTEMGVGTTFYFDLPEEHGKVPGAVDSRSRVLVCEDNHDSAALLCRILEEGGYASDVAYSAAEAKRLLQSRPYVAATLGILLPDHNGIALIQELRADTHTAALPIIVVSVMAEQSSGRLDVAALEVVDWINKPIDPLRLLAALRRAVMQGFDVKPRLLHVEDDADVRRVVAAIVGDMVHIVPAASMREAQHRLTSETFSLVLLDVELPDGSGLDLLPLIERAATPIVIFSAHDVSQEIAHKVAAVLVKSTASNQVLLDVIRHAVKAHEFPPAV